eukprot:SAG22_NODE_6_length_41368_cov_49.702222_28_plen_126_part_00
MALLALVLPLLAGPSIATTSSGEKEMRASILPAAFAVALLAAAPSGGRVAGAGTFSLEASSATDGDDKDAFIRQLAARVGELEAWREGASNKTKELEKAAETAARAAATCSRLEKEVGETKAEVQ